MKEELPPDQRLSLPPPRGTPGGQIACGACGRPVVVMPSDTEATCPACKKSLHFLRCIHCRGNFIGYRSRRLTKCPWCNLLTNTNASRINARQLLDDEASHPDRRVLIGCTVIGGYGHGLPPQTLCNLRFEATRICIDFTAPQAGGWEFPYADLLIIEIGGRGAMRSGGGFIGGGFGLEGTAEGMIVAGVLNSLTTTTRVESIISLKASNWQLIVFNGQRTPDDLRVYLAPGIARVEAANRVPPPPPPGVDFAGQLARLAALYRDGMLSEEEYETAKRSVLGGAQP